ncbi:hypothetical protein Ddc_24088 [Ditylenchus destructor]|nr:hypothetical protein Ddc_24088 [Ditylenchus destructor]
MSKINVLIITKSQTQHTLTPNHTSTEEACAALKEEGCGGSHTRLSRDFSFVGTFFLSWRFAPAKKKDLRPSAEEVPTKLKSRERHPVGFEAGRRPAEERRAR